MSSTNKHTTNSAGPGGKLPSSAGSSTAAQTASLVYETGAPDAPDCMCDIARGCWDRLVPQLEKAGALCRVDEGSLLAYCNIYARMVTHQKILLEEKEYFYASETRTGRIFRPSPAYQIVKDSEEKLKSYAAEFGLTPASRKKIQTDVSQGDLFEKDGWSGFH